MEPSSPPDHDASLAPPADTAAALDHVLYAELKRLARHHLRVHAAGATVSTTELVHEAYLKFGAPHGAWHSRAHFFGSASRAMRQVIVDYARSRHAAKRGGGDRVITLTDRVGTTPDVPLDDVLALDAALNRLRVLDERLCRVVELRYFAGLDDAQIAESLRITPRTVGRDWVKARLFLARELGAR